MTSDSGRDLETDHAVSSDRDLAPSPRPGRGEIETILAPRSNRTVRLSLSVGSERVEIVGPEGRTELSVILTENGPKLIFESADIQISAANQVTVDCGRFEVKARESVHLSGASTSIVARSGDVKVEANDRVSLVGEQIRLNCDNPDEVPPWMQRELAAQLAATVMPSLVPRRDRTGDLDQAGPVDGSVEFREDGGGEGENAD